MGEDVQRFIDRIRGEGVQAGRHRADELIAEARKHADRIITEAKEQKQRTIAEAEAEVQGRLARARTELELGVRDSALHFRDVLKRRLRDVLAYGARRHLADPSFVGKVLHEIITVSAQADRGQASEITINVPTEMREQLVQWAINEIDHRAADAIRESIDLSSTLREPGFEYKLNDATVEVTLDSVVEVLSDLIAPGFRELLDCAAAEDERQPPRNGK